MKPFTVEFKRGDRTNPLYIQLYEYIRSEIISGNMEEGAKLPALRRIARDLNLSITTVEFAYNQLSVEGYIESKPQSGFYVAKIPGPVMINKTSLMSKSADSGSQGIEKDNKTQDRTKRNYITDPDAFDFKKWRKSMMRVIDEETDLLMQEGDPQGEEALRYEISKYVFNSRGVRCQPNQVVVGAGTQQLTAHIGRLLRHIGIHLVCTEDPGYQPVNKIFEDQGYILNKIPVSSQGIDIEKLPDSKAAVYVCPNNQFPTGAVMPIASRYELLKWASFNDGLIIEDDYDSELRYFGRPISSLQGLEQYEEDSHVLYLGSFSATLFPSVKISYMILPRQLANKLDFILEGYTQTCSKTEQLALAHFMESGYYYTNIKKLRNLCGRKLSACIKVIETYGYDSVRADRTDSGLYVILSIKTDMGSKEMEEIAENMGILAYHSDDLIPIEGMKSMIFYYSRLPENQIQDLTKKMIDRWLGKR